MDTLHVPDSVAQDLYSSVFRTDFTRPGFALLNLGPDYGSTQQRRLMVGLKQQLNRLERQHRQRRLVYQSLGRFNQQVTTKPHRDGGPDESILMLGYEPTHVKSQLAILDYSRCAHDHGMTPAEFLDRFNPMFTEGQEKLACYTTAVSDFDASCFQILLINNSTSPPGNQQIPGVLHTAEIINPTASLMRVVNSTMIGSVPQDTADDVSINKETEFVSTTVIRNAGDD